MSDKSAIEWTDATWNPIRGCSRVSEGCRNCYAERVAARFSGPGMPYEGLAVMRNGEPRWTGEVRLIEKHLHDPLRWKRPRRVFVNSMSDLFHEGLTDEDIDKVFAVMALAPQHTFQILTKRPVRMREYLSAPDVEARWTAIIHTMRERPSWFGRLTRGWWPQRHVWLGISAENQATADERIPHLLAAPAAVRFVSAEPLLGPIDLGDALGRISEAHEPNRHAPGLDWVIVGGESGPNARVLNVGWVRDIVRQCKTARVACFVKQLGAHPQEIANTVEMDPPEAGDIMGMMNRARTHPAPDGWTRVTIAATGESRLLRDLRLQSNKGGDWSEWPDDLRVREYPR